VDSISVITDKELRKIERVIEVLNVPLRKFYERNIYLEVPVFGGVEVRCYSLLALSLLEASSRHFSCFSILMVGVSFR
jgi:hypothetical protein